MLSLSRYMHCRAKYVRRSGVVASSGSRTSFCCSNCALLWKLRVTARGELLLTTAPFTISFSFGFKTSLSGIVPPRRFRCGAFTHDDYARSSANEVIGHLQQVVGRRDDLGIGLVGTLRLDQLGELGGDVDIGAFDARGNDGPGAVLAGCVDRRRAARHGRAEGVAVLRLQAVVVREADERDLKLGLARAVVEIERDEAVRIDVEVAERSGRQAILLRRDEVDVGAGEHRRLLGD